jgi:hypothetical protein
VVSKWRKRFHDQCLPGLADLPGEDGPKFPLIVMVAVKALTCEPPTTPRAPLARWQCPDLARTAVEHIVASISGTAMWRRLSADMIKPPAALLLDLPLAIHLNVQFAYRGPLLPQPLALAVGRLRTQLSTSVRGAVFASGSLTALRRWLDTPAGRDDRDGWRALHDSAGASSVARAQARGQLAGIDFEFG